jgi:hypothetical protein
MRPRCRRRSTARPQTDMNVAYCGAQRNSFLRTAPWTKDHIADVTNVCECFLTLNFWCSLQREDPT